MHSSLKKRVGFDHEHPATPTDELYTIIGKPTQILEEPIAKYARLSYGNNQELLFNIDTQVYYLLNYIVTKCGSKELQIALDTIDLVDINGDLKNLRNHRVKNEYASSLLTARAVYILVEIKDGDTEFPIVTPLLKNSDLLTPKLLTKLESLNHKVTQPHVVTLTTAPKPVLLKQTKKNKNNAQHLEAS